MVYFSALANVNGIFCDTFKGTAETRADIPAAVERLAVRFGDIFTLEIVELITADTADELAEKEYNF